MKLLATIAAVVLLIEPFAARTDPTYLLRDSKDQKGSRASKRSIVLNLNEAKGTIEKRVLGFDGYKGNSYFGNNTIEFVTVETGIPMVLDRTTRWAVAKG